MIIDGDHNARHQSWFYARWNPNGGRHYGFLTNAHSRACPISAQPFDKFYNTRIWTPSLLEVELLLTFILIRILSWKAPPVLKSLISSLLTLPERVSFPASSSVPYYQKNLKSRFWQHFTAIVTFPWIFRYSFVGPNNVTSVSCSVRPID